MAGTFPEWWEPDKSKGFCYQTHSSQSESKGKTTLEDNRRKQEKKLYFIHILQQVIREFLFQLNIMHIHQTWIQLLQPQV